MSPSSHITQGNEKLRACLGVEISRVLEHVLRARVFSIGYLFSHLQLSPNSSSKRTFLTSLPLKPTGPLFPLLYQICQYSSSVLLTLLSH